MATETAPQHQTDNHSRPARRFRRSYPGRHVSQESGHTHGLPQPDLSLDTTPSCKTTLEKVLAFCRGHKSYTPPAEDEPIKSIGPKFDDISRYGISNAKEDKLWQIEATRLLAAVSNFSEPLLFESPIVRWDINKAELEKISELGNQGLHCLNICTHDNQLLLFESMRDLFEPSKYMRARNILSHAFDTVGSASKLGQPNGRERPMDLSIHGKTVEVFCAVVDYTTAVLARFALRGIPTEFWHTRALAGLAKTSAKMKFLFADIEKFALQSLDDGQDVLAKDEVFNVLGSTGKMPVLDIVGPDGQPFQVRQPSKDETGREDATDMMNVRRLLSYDERAVDVYFSDMAMTGSWTIDSVRLALFSFQSSMISGNPTDAFDICSLIYRAGLNGLLTLIHQDRDGELMGSTSREFIRLSYSGFKMLYQVASELRRDGAGIHQGEPRQAHAPDDNNGALLVFDFDEEKARDKREAPGPVLGDKDSFRLDLSTMGDLISVMVPLLCTQPMQLLNLVWAMEIVTGVTSVMHTIDYNTLPGPRFTAFASLRTNVYENVVWPKLEGSDARPLSRSLVAQNRLHTYDQREITDTKVWDGLPISKRHDITGESERKLGELEEKFRRWTIEEKAIVVRKPRFVILLMLGCAVLVIGGIMVGVFLGQRLTGVDPFNITVYAWVLAGFTILVGKSLLVSEWPWREFLRARVPCRSITELQAVTGAEPQEVLEYLLSMEIYTILITKGPYNRPFARRSNDGSDGFSIDVKIELRTLLASGILVIKVAGRKGVGLVCMDLRRGTPGRAKISHSDEITEDEIVLGCFDLQEVFDEDQDIPLLRVQTSWRRIVGIYHRAKKEFR
ncbi:hypothetical protein B0T24DRAFT_692654 [Lasiosphaeria ovina]|uniref:Uncharacterized protein n=1 Tax=Lasiosphaeria ovina TaxID=92902 RepID=A0AAE0JSJ0_9PEZI|nr:hypothetical protein B0T24DRAFT_692654 [Lasiosphaeria ovina]